MLMLVKLFCEFYLTWVCLFIWYQHKYTIVSGGPRDVRYEKSAGEIMESGDCIDVHLIVRVEINKIKNVSEIHQVLVFPRHPHIGQRARS